MSAIGAPDTTIQIDFDKAPEIRMFGTRNKLDAINGANNDAGFAAGASMLIDDCKLFRLFLSGPLKWIHCFPIDR